MSYLVDTNVISELISRQPDGRVVNWIDGVDDQIVYLSVITLGEIKRGIEKLPDSQRQRRLNSWLSEDLLIRFAGKILPLDLPVMLTWGELLARLEGQGRVLPAIDSLIAATALHHDMNLVTRNEKDFQGLGIEIINPWLA